MAPFKCSVARWVARVEALISRSALLILKVESSTVLDREGITVTALGIPHGNIPALAYRVQTRNVSIVFSTDQTGTNSRFIEFAQGANVLVMHFATATSDNPFHASPAVVGRVARDAGVKRLILSHIGQFDIEPAIAELKKFYTRSPDHWC